MPYKHLLAMVLHITTHAAFLILLVVTASHVANAGDPDIVTDFVLPPNATAVDGNFFTSTALRSLMSTDDEPLNFTVLKTTMAEFPALNGQSVSSAVLFFPSGSINPPHTHPRSAELLFLVGGALEVGFVDTANKLYTQTLQSGDMFVFPKGLVHYQFNSGRDTSVAVSSFGSASPGTVSAPVSLFTTGIDDVVLAKSFKTDVATILKIKAALKPKV